jgi:hypothetical protein
MIANLKRISRDKTFLVTLVLAILALSLGTVHLRDIDLKTLLALFSLMVTIAIYEKLHLLDISQISSSKNVSQLERLSW